LGFACDLGGVLRILTHLYRDVTEAQSQHNYRCADWAKTSGITGISQMSSFELWTSIRKRSESWLHSSCISEKFTAKHEVQGKPRQTCPLEDVTDVWCIGWKERCSGTSAMLKKYIL
jgi:hypothetical protein